MRLGEATQVELDRDARCLLAGETTVLRGALEVPLAALGRQALSSTPPDVHASLADRPEYGQSFAKLTFIASAGQVALGTVLHRVMSPSSESSKKPDNSNARSAIVE